MHRTTGHLDTVTDQSLQNGEASVIQPGQGKQQCLGQEFVICGCGCYLHLFGKEQINLSLRNPEWGHL